MKSIYNRIQVGHTVTFDGAEHYVKALSSGKIQLGLGSENDLSAPESGGGFWVNPCDTLWDAQEADLDVYQAYSLTKCVPCADAGLSGPDLCASCQANRNAINTLKAVIGSA